MPFFCQLTGWHKKNQLESFWWDFVDGSRIGRVKNMFLIEIQLNMSENNNVTSCICAYQYAVSNIIILMRMILTFYCEMIIIFFLPMKYSCCIF